MEVEMRTNLAYIDATAGTALAREEESPTLLAVEREQAVNAGRTIIAGFVVNDDSAQSEGLAKATRRRKAQLESYRNDRATILSALQVRNITPLAVLPKTAWEQICARSGLFRLSPFTDGTVYVSDKLVKEAQEIGDRSSFRYALTLGLSIGLCAGVYADIPWWDSILLGLFVSLFSFVIVALCFNAVWFKDFSSKDYVALSIAQAYLKRKSKRPWSQQLADLFPEGTSLSASEVSAQLVLPDPPADVQALLLKARSFRLRVAAVADAISFKETPDLFLFRELDRRMVNDPIVYIEQDNAVAIIAQFGDFPIEQ